MSEQFPFLRDYRPPVKPEVLIYEELQVTNGYLSILVQIFKAAFPQAVSPDTENRIKGIEEWRSRQSQEGAGDEQESE